MRDEEAEFEAYLMQELSKEVQKATKETESVLKKEVKESIYDAYTPGNYHRTNNLQNSIVSKCNGTNAEVSFDESQLKHTNIYGENEKLIPNFLDYGWQHDNYYGEVDYFHRRNPASFLENTVKKMQENEDYNNLFKFEIVNE